MCKNQQCAADLERRRNIPALAKEKEITPKAPGSELGSDQQRGAGVDIEPVAKQCSNRRIGREKRDVRHFHRLMIDRRNNRLVSAVDDVHKPIAIVLEKRGIAI